MIALSQRKVVARAGSAAMSGAFCHARLFSFSHALQYLGTSHVNPVLTIYAWGRQARRS
jgi:hypothetical protein